MNPCFQRVGDVGQVANLCFPQRRSESLGEPGQMAPSQPFGDTFKVHRLADPSARDRLAFKVSNVRHETDQRRDVIGGFSCNREVA